MTYNQLVEEVVYHVLSTDGFIEETCDEYTKELNLTNYMMEKLKEDVRSEVMYIRGGE